MDLAYSGAVNIYAKWTIEQFIDSAIPFLGGVAQIGSV